MARPASTEFADETELQHQSATTLLSRLISAFTELVRNEVALAKAELSDSTTRARSGIVALIGAVSTLLAGSLALVAAIILGLAKVMEPWLAALIVGAVISGVGLLLLRGARKKLLPPHLEIERTRTAVRQDVEVLARRT
jgi:lipopolysaccharide export LptBFGC system permease protein LptF